MRPLLFQALVIGALLFVSTVSQQIGHAQAMAEAFARGAAVQCPGQRAYRWDCGE